MPSTQDIIDIQNARKTFGRRILALRGVQMKVQRGEIFGLLGPNGAGKSTLVKILMTVVRPDKVEGTLLGLPVGNKEALARVGYLPEHHHFPNYLTGRQVIEFSGAMTGMHGPQRRKNAGRLLDRVGMTEWADKRLRSYSKGMLQRVGLAQALVNSPDLVVLDEPTDGVDPVGRREIRDLLLELRDEGMTVFLNSHLLSELEMICDRVAILVQGQVSMQGTIDDLTADSRRYEIDCSGPPPSWIDELPQARCEADSDITRIRFITDDADEIQPLLDRLRKDGRSIKRVQAVRENLEDLFMRAVTDESGQVAAPGAIVQDQPRRGGDA